MVRDVRNDFLRVILQEMVFQEDRPDYALEVVAIPQAGPLVNLGDVYSKATHDRLCCEVPRYPPGS